MRCQVYVDPLFGSERYIEFDPNWVAEAQDVMYRVTPWRKYPVTKIKFANGRRYMIMGHWAERIKAAQGQAEESGGGPQQDVGDKVDEADPGNFGRNIRLG